MRWISGLLVNISWERGLDVVVMGLERYLNISSIISLLGCVSGGLFCDAGMSRPYRPSKRGAGFRVRCHTYSWRGDANPRYRSALNNNLDTRWPESVLETLTSLGSFPPRSTAKQVDPYALPANMIPQFPFLLLVLSLTTLSLCYDPLFGTISAEDAMAWIQQSQPAADGSDATSRWFWRTDAARKVAAAKPGEDIRTPWLDPVNAGQLFIPIYVKVAY